jgi:hypothetical protein
MCTALLPARSYFFYENLPACLQLVKFFSGTKINLNQDKLRPVSSAAPLDAVLRIHDILGWIRFRIRGSMPLTKIDLDPDPAIFVIDLQDTRKKLTFQHNFFCLLLFEATFTSFFTHKKSKRVTK